jgi:hypothetical protein
MSRKALLPGQAPVGTSDYGLVAIAMNGLYMRSPRHFVGVETRFIHTVA